MDEKISLRPTSVVVFRGQARVRREGDIQIDAGDNLLVIPDLPRSVDPESLRVSGRGEFVIKDFELKTVYLAEYEEAAVAAMREQMQEIEARAADLANQKTLNDQAKHMLTTLADEAMGSYARAMAFEKTSLEQMKSLREYLDDSLRDVLAEGHAIAVKMAEIQKELEAAHKKYKDLVSSRDRVRQEAVIRVSADRETGGSLAVEYHVRDAHWSPQYELRLKGGELVLSYVAMVTQGSGEDWDSVEMILSTATPSISTRIPELDPWYIDLFQGRALMRDAGMAMKMESAMAAPMPAAAAAYDEAEVQEEGTAVTYRITYPVTITSDHQPHKVTVGGASWEPEITCISFPSLSDQVLIRAEARNTSPYTLLPGPTAIFNEGDYMGKGDLPLIVPGENVEAMMGVDNRVRVERERVKREVVKSRIGTMRKESHGYQIRITNHRTDTLKCEIVDQIPVSVNADLKVEAVSTSPQPFEVSDLNIMRWKLSLAPGQTQVITYTFTVEFPKDQRVTGLR